MRVRFRLVCVAGAVAFSLTAGSAMPVRAADPLGIGPGAIVARVRDQNGRPVGGAHVVAEGPAARDATTTIGGVVTLLDLPLGIYDLRVTREGYESSDTHVRVDQRSTLRITDVRVALSSFGALGERGGTQTLRERPRAEGDPTTVHALASASGVAFVPSGARAGGASATLIGTSPNETRYELDGIPLAGGAAGAASLSVRDGLDIDAVELARGPVARSTTPRDAAGGIINYRTIQPGNGDGASLGAGYSSYFGYFQQYRLSRRQGRLAVAFDLTTGDSNAHAQTYKAEYAFSRATAIALASYGLQTNVDGYSLSAPITAADLRTSLGRAAVHLRAYTSASRALVTASPATVAAARSAGAPANFTSPAAYLQDGLLANESLRGTQAELALPLGIALAQASLDHRNERGTLPSGALVRRSFDTQTLRADVQLGGNAHVMLSDALSSGTALASRNDPQVSFSLRAGDQTTLRASAGSSYVIAPASTYAAQGSPLFDAPETAFGYRLDVEQQVTPQTRFYGDAYSLRLRDRYAALSDATTSGVEVGYDTDSLPEHVTFSGYVDVERSIAFGAPQPAARYEAAPQTSLALAPSAQQPGDPFAKARFEAAYRTVGGAEVRVGNTFFGANNAFSNGPVSLADATLRVPLEAFDVRLGLSNAFGAAIAAPGLGPYFAPRQMTFSLEHALFGSAP